MDKNTSQRGRASSGVSIILGPDLLKEWNMAGKPTPINSASNSDFLGRMIGVNLCFTNRPNKISDINHKKVRWTIKIFLSLIYHLVEHYYQKRYNEELASFYNTITINANRLSVQDVNANVGIQSKIFSDVLGQQGLDNRNV